MNNEGFYATKAKKHVYREALNKPRFVNLKLNVFLSPAPLFHFYTSYVTYLPPISRKGFSCFPPVHDKVQHFSTT